MHVSHPQAFIIYIAAPLKQEALREVEMRNLPPNLEATHIYTARLSESGARSVKIIIRSLETSSSSAQAAAAALPCRWPGLLNQRFTSTGVFGGGGTAVTINVKPLLLFLPLWALNLDHMALPADRLASQAPKERPRLSWFQWLCFLS